MKSLSTVNAFKHISSDACITLTPEQLRQLQQVLLEIMKDIHQVCQKHSITYTLGGGSALGAVRHGGFIPWDDDVDLNMSRADYQRFVEVFPQECGDRYWLHTPAETNNYGLLLARVRKKGTCLKTREDFFNHDECGVFVDIFIVENTYDDPIRRTLHGLGCQAFGLALSCRKFYRDREFLLPLAEHDPELLRVFKIKIALGRVTALLGIDIWTRWADRWNALCKNHHTRHVTIPVGRRHFFGELGAREDLCRPRMMAFEDTQFPCPADAEGYLTRLYGDYLTIPEGADRETHSFFLPFQPQPEE